MALGPLRIDHHVDMFLGSHVGLRDRNHATLPPRPLLRRGSEGRAAAGRPAHGDGGGQAARWHRSHGAHRPSRPAAQLAGIALATPPRLALYRPLHGRSVGAERTDAVFLGHVQAAPLAARQRPPGQRALRGETHRRREYAALCRHTRIGHRRLVAQKPQSADE